MIQGSFMSFMAVHAVLYTPFNLGLRPRFGSLASSLLSPAPFTLPLAVFSAPLQAINHQTTRRQPGCPSFPYSFWRRTQGLRPVFFYPPIEVGQRIEQRGGLLWGRRGTRVPRARPAGAPPRAHVFSVRLRGPWPHRCSHG
eukprot:COSAG04_NODE_146_length_22922_cov_53.506901_12_plen_141_part_00